MIRRWSFFLERWVQRGILHQLLLMAGLIVAVAVAGGVVAWLATPQFERPLPAIWWAFLRLSDPGYLGDDEGTVLRIISTTVMILGYVLFMGSLIAIMTQWLAGTIRRLESGVTPIAMQDHVVILGWTNRTPEIILKLLNARGRLRRFLERHDTRKLRIVILAEDVGIVRRNELRAYLGEHWNESQLFLRSGSSLQPDDLERLDIGRAATVLVPGSEYELGGVEQTDTRLIKTLLTLNGIFERDPELRPRVVAEVLDPGNVALARSALEGVEVVLSDRLISRLVFQGICNRGLARVLIDLLTHHGGPSLYVRHLPELAGCGPQAAAERFSRAIMIGFVRADEAGRTMHFVLGEAPALREEDVIVFLAERYDDCRPDGDAPQRSPQVERPRASPPSSVGGEQRILILGWSHKIRPLLEELEASERRIEVILLSRVSVDERMRELGERPDSADRVRVGHVEGDYASEDDLAAVRPADCDSVICFASDRMSSAEQADARTILGYVQLRALLQGVARPPEIIVELEDPPNANLLDRRGVVLVSPRVVSHLLGHVALRSELETVFDALFCAGGVALKLYEAGDLGIVGRTASFSELQHLARAHDLVLLGIVTGEAGAEQIPLIPDRDEQRSVKPDDRLVVLAAESSPSG